ncbi:SlyX family protein [Pelagibacterium xiamenense]|uniref:SlyX family protein n=1 Tax=Pelagibacterium xiamenense TaxID=2901140 RepID=UPI001E30554B|nr:SlyX family protein [Pelagibacterium xiamenense]MCD7060561.1 SlyX family protein [Pelagibacterium xiamenense]
MNDNDLKDRIEALEIRQAHADRTIDELNALVTEQFQTIERLKRRIAMLDDQLSAVETLARTQAKEPPPPHY